MYVWADESAVGIELRELHGDVRGSAADRFGDGGSLSEKGSGVRRRGR